MKNKIIQIIIPTYNEDKNIFNIIQKIFQIKITNFIFKILIIDSNSTDKTQSIIKNCIKQNKNISLIVQNIKKGIGNAYKKAFKFLEKQYFYAIITMDADEQHDLQFISKAITFLDKKYNFINASRFLPNSKIEDHKYKRKKITAVLNYILKIKSPKIRKLNLTDVSSGLQCIKYDVFKQLDIELLSDGYEFQIDLKKQIANFNNVKSKEIPIIFYSRKNNKSKNVYSILQKIKYAFHFLK